MKDDTEDVDDTQDSEHFDSRQSFLNLCQGNHYQFDQLRRAKHSSMMVLYHLHNPDAPKFVPTCHMCHADILIGYKHSCRTCEVDFCGACHTMMQQGRVARHQHPLVPTAVGGSTAPTQLTEEQRKERARSIQLHMQLLQHAAGCTIAAGGPQCTSRNCQKMKEFLMHESTCNVKAARGCRLCLRVHNLIQLHARNCKQDLCPVPRCIEIREQNRHNVMRQQQMDDRRRAMMNNLYSGGNGNAPEDSQPNGDSASAEEEA